jgi:hypothetical protein
MTVCAWCEINKPSREIVHKRRGKEPVCSLCLSLYRTLRAYPKIYKEPLTLAIAASKQRYYNQIHHLCGW